MNTIINETAEQAFLMCLIRHPKLYDQVRFLIRKTHFTLIKSQKLYEVFEEWVEINKSETDFIGYSEFVSYVEIQYSEWFKNNKDFLLEASKRIIDKEQAIEKWKHYYRTLEKLYIQNSFIEILSTSIKEAGDAPLDVKNHILNLQSRITKAYSGMNLLESDSSLTSAMNNFRNEFLKRMRKDYKPAYSGLSIFDEMHGGFFPNSYHLITARSSVGKSALSLCMAKNMLLHQGKKVAFFNIETNNFSFFTRWFAQELKVNLSQLKDPKLLTEEQRRRLFAYQEDLLKKYDGMFHAEEDTSYLNNIMDKILNIYNTYGLDIVFLDLLEYIRVKERFENRRREIAYISNEIFQLRKKIPVAFVMIQQQNKEGEKGAAQASGRESEDPYMQADSAISLYKFKDENGKVDPDKRTLTVNKNRDGETGSINVKFNKEMTLFEDDFIGGKLE